MDQLKRLYASLSLAQRISILVLAPLIIFGVIQFSRWSKERDFRPLYQGIAAEDAGGVVAKLKESGVEYRVTDGGGTILVPSERVAELRLQMASAGLPKSGRIGFELFDKVNVMTSDFAEQVNFRRALEGELERSIGTLTEIDQARVHLTFAKDSVFTESKQPAKASVVLKLKTGVALSAGNVSAIEHLVASAVEGLQPAAVSVLDMRGNLLSRPLRPNSNGIDEPADAIEFRQKLERDLLGKINVTLEPLLGPDHFRAAVSLDCDFTSGEQSEEVYDPNRSVITNAQRSEDTTNSAIASGVPGSASNLPRPVGGVGRQQLGVARRTENISYQTSRTVKRLRLPQGNVRRMSVSVLLDHHVRFEGSGPKMKRVVEPVPADRIKSIHDLIAGVTGLSLERGDQLVVETMAFDATLNGEPPTAAPVTARPDALPNWLPKPLRDPKILAVTGVGLIVLLGAVAAFAFFRRKPARAVETQAAIDGAHVGTAGALEPPNGELRRTLDEQIAEHSAERERQLAEAMEQLAPPNIKTKKAEALVKHLTTEAKKDPEIIAQLVRSWLMEGNR